MDIHIFEPQGIRFLETESTFLTNELASALTTSQNETKVGLPWSAGEDTKGACLQARPVSPDFQSGTVGQDR